MVEKLCDDLNVYLQREFNYKSLPASIVWGDKILANRAKFDLYLRYRLSNRPSLVIARIGFRETRKGHGSRFLKFLCDKAPEHGIESIVLESVNENSARFGQKFGFVDGIHSNMTVTIEKLVLHLNARNPQ